MIRIWIRKYIRIRIRNSRKIRQLLQSNKLVWWPMFPTFACWRQMGDLPYCTVSFYLKNQTKWHTRQKWQLGTWPGVLHKTKATTCLMARCPARDKARTCRMARGPARDKSDNLSDGQGSSALSLAFFLLLELARARGTPWLARCSITCSAPGFRLQ